MLDARFAKQWLSCEGVVCSVSMARTSLIVCKFVCDELMACMMIYVVIEASMF
jgi:hypothetical protein